MTPIVIAHRTCPRHAPENSIEGIRRAFELGADAVEIDVRLTRDRVPILMHDPTPQRTAGARLPIWLTSSNRARQLRLSNGEPVPLLAEALAALPPGGRVAIDVKASRAIAATILEVRDHELETRTLLWSQHLHAVRFAADHMPEAEPALLRDTRSPWGTARFLRDARISGAQAISVDWQTVTPPFEAKVRERGLKLYSWCKDPRPEPERLAMIDGVVTDWPDDARPQ